MTFVLANPSLLFLQALFPSPPQESPQPPEAFERGEYICHCLIDGAWGEGRILGSSLSHNGYKRSRDTVLGHHGDKEKWMSNTSEFKLSQESQASRGWKLQAHSMHSQADQRQEYAPVCTCEQVLIWRGHPGVIDMSDLSFLSALMFLFSSIKFPSALLSALFFSS